MNKNNHKLSRTIKQKLRKDREKDRDTAISRSVFTEACSFTNFSKIKIKVNDTDRRQNFSRQNQPKTPNYCYQKPAVSFKFAKLPDDVESGGRGENEKVFAVPETDDESDLSWSNLFMLVNPSFCILQVRISLILRVLRAGL